jgi:hypothetical protein
MITRTRQKFRFFAFFLLTLVSCTQSEKKITGTIEISPELQKTIKSDAVLYIVARREGETAGPPVAVKRFTQPFVFPLTFNLSQHDAMIPDVPFEGKFTVTARIAQKGAATPINLGDIEGDAKPSSVSIGENNLKIMLNRTH